MNPDSENSPRVAIAILNYNGREVTAECLDSLAEIDYSGHEVVLVDNGSKDGSPEFFKERYRDVTLIENGENLGFTGGNNAAISYAMARDFDYVLLLNNDTVVDPSFLTELVRVAEERSDVGMLNPKIWFYDFPDLLWYAGGRISFFKGVEHFGFKKRCGPELDRQQEVTFITGCAFLIKRAVLEKVGPLDDRLFAYCEDLDWSFKVREAGFKGLYVPESVIWHKEGIDAKKNKSNAFRKYLGTRNLLFVFYRHFPHLKFALFLLYYVLLWGPSKSVRYLLAGELKTMLYSWKGAIEFLAMKKTP